jgi:hypothetical protein
VSRLLVVRGVASIDELQSLGLPMAQKYEDADVVALVGRKGAGVVVKGFPGESVVVELIDADPSIGRCQRAVDRVHEAAEQNPMPPGAEYWVGMFLYYWPLKQGAVEVVAGGIERGDFEAVEAAAEQFIRCDFGADLSKLSGNEHSDAAGHAADGAPS